MRTATRLVATITAKANQVAIAGHDDQRVRTTAAKNAELACPLGKLEVRGLRILNRESPLTVGRSRLKKGLMPWFKIRLSMPINAESISACLARELSATARTMPTMCHNMPKSPSAVAVVNNQIVGLKLREGSSRRSKRVSNATSREDRLSDIRNVL